MLHIAIYDVKLNSLQQTSKLIKEIFNTYTDFFLIKDFESSDKLLSTAYLFQVVFLSIDKDNDCIKIGRQLYRNNHHLKIIYLAENNIIHSYCLDALNKSHAYAFVERPLQKKQVEELSNDIINEYMENQEITIEFRNVKYVSDTNELKLPVVKLTVKNIIYFEYIKSQRAIKVITDHGEFLFSGTVNHLEERMLPLGFEISCQGILVNLDKIVRIKGYTIYLKNGETVPLSQRRVSKFKQAVMNHIRGFYD